MMEIVDVFFDTGNLRAATFSNDALISESGKNLVKLLKLHPRLTYLNINDNNLSDKEISEIARELETSTTLKHLYPRNNNITKEGFNDIAIMISKNSSINTLFFFDPQQDVLNAMVFSQCLMSNHTLLNTDSEAIIDRDNQDEIENFSEMLNSF